MQKFLALFSPRDQKVFWRLVILKKGTAGIAVLKTVDIDIDSKIKLKGGLADNWFTELRQWAGSRFQCCSSCTKVS